MNFVDKLRAAWRERDSLLCVGLDPDPARLPAHLAGRRDAIARFCIEVVDATAPFVCAFKPQIAYFAAQRAEDQLERVCEHVRRAHPGVALVLDAKRGDIGATAEQYAAEAFDRYGADALTASPYMGLDSFEPYLARPGRGVFLLCRTSNAGGADIQDLALEGGERLYERVARLAAGTWNRGGQLGLVVGATFPRELARVREIVGDLPLLVPGVGAQGGDVEQTVAAGASGPSADGMLINSSRAILYADAGTGFAAAAADAARRTREAINAARVRRRPG